MLVGDEAELVEDGLKGVLRLLDALGNLDLLLAGEQGYLPHLLEVHPYRVVQDVQPWHLRVVLGLLALDAVHVRRIHDIDVEPAEDDQDVIQILRIDHVLGESVADVGVSEMALLLREFDEFLDLVVLDLAAEGRLAWGTNGQHAHQGATDRGGFPRSALGGQGCLGSGSGLGWHDDLCWYLDLRGLCWHRSLSRLRGRRRSFHGHRFHLGSGNDRAGFRRFFGAGKAP